MTEFAQYIALGDSTSIDLYPALDAGAIDMAVALEWEMSAGTVAPLGAASLLYRNDDERWPEFAGKDLVSRYGEIAAQNVAEDDATIGDVFGAQLPRIKPSDAATLLTLSVGGNDLLSAFGNKPDASLLRNVVKDIAAAYEFLVESIDRTLPNATLVLTTIYDPSDGTRKIPGVLGGAGPLPLESLHELNTRIRELGKVARRGVVADIHGHFLGHGATAIPSEQWYWTRSRIEPNATGASEIRRIWLDAVGIANED